MVMIIDQKYYAPVLNKPMFDGIEIAIDDKWDVYYIRDGKIIHDEYFTPPQIISIALVCLKYQFKSYEFTDSNILLFKNRFNELIQYNNKMQLQTLVNLTLLKLDKEIEEGLRKVRTSNGKVSR
jgi:hypothetical protein